MVMATMMRIYISYDYTGYPKNCYIYINHRQRIRHHFVLHLYIAGNVETDI